MFVFRDVFQLRKVTKIHFIENHSIDFRACLFKVFVMLVSTESDNPASAFTIKNIFTCNICSFKSQLKKKFVLILMIVFITLAVFSDQILQLAS